MIEHDLEGPSRRNVGMGRFDEYYEDLADGVGYDEAFGPRDRVIRGNSPYS